MTTPRKWLMRLGLVMLIPTLLVIGVLLWVGGTLLFYHQSDDQTHLALKQEYLAGLRQEASRVDLSDRSAFPNIVFLLYDDLGYGDIGAFGAQAIATPNIDALAAGGIKLTQFYSPSPVCTPSRAGILTGRMPPRAGLSNVVFPASSPLSAMTKLNGLNVRLPAEEITMADMLSAAGYQTAMIGKWHIGESSPSLPNDFGFQSFFGSLHSNDMEPFALYRDKKIEVEYPADQTKLDALYTHEAVDVIEREAGNSDVPFFLYFAHNFPHVPLHVERHRKGRSRGGLYGDVIESLDEGVGQIVAALEGADALDETIIIVSSDNGPWWQGDAAALRGRKGKTWEGGMRVPFIIHWPARLDAGQELSDMAMGTDLLPSLADWLGLSLPKDRIIDGRSIAPMLEDNAGTPHEYLYYFAIEEALALRNTTHKYHGVRNVNYGPMNMPVAFSSPEGPWLINLELDPREAYDTSLHDPELAATMANALAEKRLEMERNRRGWIEP